MNDRLPNFRDETGKLFLIRCFACDPIDGRENYAPIASTGLCAWCGWEDDANEN